MKSIAQSPRPPFFCQVTAAPHELGSNSNANRRFAQLGSNSNANRRFAQLGSNSNATPNGVARAQAGSSLNIEVRPPSTTRS